VLFLLTVVAIIYSKWTTKKNNISSYYFTQWIRQASFTRRSACCCWAAENFSRGFDFHYKYLDSGHTRPPDLEKGSWLISLFSAQVKNSIKTVQNIQNAKHLCFNALSDDCTMMQRYIKLHTADCRMTTTLRLFKKVSHTMHAKNGQKSQNFTTYNK